jgi:glycosyltransferase involved in cell wall biosynthesis
MEGKLNIAILGTRGIPNRYGGFEAFAEQVSVRLAAKGHRVTVYCSHDQDYREHEFNGVRLVFCHNPERMAGTAGQFLYDLNCNLHARRQPYDVILHLGYTSDSVWTWLWSGKAKHITNMDGMEWMRQKYATLVQRFLKLAEKRAASGSCLMIADSRAVQEYLEARYDTPVRYISYGAEIPDYFDPSVLASFGLNEHGYDLVIARMEPENNIEIAILAKLDEGGSIPLLIISNNTVYGDLLKKRYENDRLIRFQQAIYQPNVLNALRHFSRYYIHGHSAGGTNPSLLEAMACRCRILAHDNPFNRSVLQKNGWFFSGRDPLTALLRRDFLPEALAGAIENNLECIRINHSWEFITNEYEHVFRQVL